MQSPSHSDSTKRDTEVSEKAKEQAKSAEKNVREGYGGTLKSRLMSAKPDGDTQGGPGANNDNANKPVER